jgi:hypothetical protein
MDELQSRIDELYSGRPEPLTDAEAVAEMVEIQLILKQLKAAHFRMLADLERRGLHPWRHRV